LLTYTTTANSTSTKPEGRLVMARNTWVRGILPPLACLGSGLRCRISIAHSSGLPCRVLLLASSSRAATVVLLLIVIVVILVVAPGRPPSDFSQLLGNFHLVLFVAHQLDLKGKTSHCM
jgi:hypothetical protein